MIKLEKYENLMRKYLFVTNGLHTGVHGYREAQLIRDRKGKGLTICLTDGYKVIKYNTYSNVFRAKKAFRELAIRINKGYKE